MATRGIQQIKSLTIRYCEYGGSSSTVRQYLNSNKIIQLAESYPKVEINVKVKGNRHPNISAEYINGKFKQIGIKNEPMKAVEKSIEKLLNSSGRKITKINKDIKTFRPSTQGVWTPYLDIVKSDFDIKIMQNEE